jgi:hypothetical protein
MAAGFLRGDAGRATIRTSRTTDRNMSIGTTPHLASARTRRSVKPRLDRPDLRKGHSAWWRGALYAVEEVELHGERWMAVLVRPADRGVPGARCLFAPCAELSFEG